MMTFEEAKKINDKIFNDFLTEVKSELKNMGVDENLINSVPEGSIWNGIINNWSPKDVAWALVQ